MTDAEIAAIKARAEAAMPGPWWMTEDGVIWGGGHPHEHMPGDPDDLLDEIVVDSSYYDADREFITHARADIPALVAAYEAALEIVRAVAAFPAAQDEAQTPMARLMTIREQARALLGMGEGEEEAQS